MRQKLTIELEDLDRAKEAVFQPDIRSDLAKDIIAFLTRLKVRGSRKQERERCIGHPLTRPMIS
jgi:hypothetical protein